MLGAVDALIPEGAVLSIDTTRASVARMALEHGAQIINDVSGGQLDREVPHVVAEHAESLYIVQHWRGWLAGSAGDVPDANTSVYANGVVNDVYDELMKQVDDVLQAGVSPSQIIIDPGFDSPNRASNITSADGGVGAVQRHRVSGADRSLAQTIRRRGACRCRYRRAKHGQQRQCDRRHQRLVRRIWSVGRARA